ncbi:gnat family [Fusarium albosuccineum]|uniref:Gnat family n=1 Tax=Fusarium albosuccineum TaxID=1237068 RepID=A0A8H4L673_9HYPO|nr:gnat family [Fusarium albosuccineum]
MISTDAPRTVRHPQPAGAKTWGRMHGLKRPDSRTPLTAPLDGSSKRPSPYWRRHKGQLDCMVRDGVINGRLVRRMDAYKRHDPGDKHDPFHNLVSRFPFWGTVCRFPSWVDSVEGEQTIPARSLRKPTPTTTTRNNNSHTHIRANTMAETLKSLTPLPGPLNARLATKADLEHITGVVWDSYLDDPGCPYKFPGREEYPKDFLKWTKLEYKEYLNQPDKFFTGVVTAPMISDDDKPVEQLISISVWDDAPQTKAIGGDRGIDDRLDANPQHMRAYTDAAERGFRDYFAQYGNNQFNLVWLMTLPSFRRRKAGTMLCNLRDNEAIEKRKVFTVMASPMGKLLYEDIGYECLGSVTAQVEGEKECVQIYILVKCSHLAMTA